MDINLRKRRLFPLCIIPLMLLCGIGFCASKPNTPQLLDIVFIGNSITYGVHLKSPKEEATPVIACKYIQAKSKKVDVQLYNNGKRGFTTVDFLPEGKAFTELVNATKKMHHDKKGLLIFSISLGTNDSAIKGTNGAPVSPDNYFKNMQAIIDHLLAEFPNSKFVLQQPIWYSSNTQNNSSYLQEGLDRLQTYFPQLKALVKYYSGINQGHVFLGDHKGFSYFKKNYLTDFTPENGLKGTFYLHPNKKGAVVLGNLWGKAIYKNLKHF